MFDKGVIICISIPIICIIIVIGYIEFVLYDEDEFVALYEYYAYYQDDLNISKLIFELDKENISYYLEEDNMTIECNFGKTFNNINLKDTNCWIYNSDCPLISIRLYNSDITSRFSTKSLDDYEDDLKSSMGYITRIVENANGHKPVSYKFKGGDGAPLKYPNLNLLV